MDKGIGWGWRDGGKTPQGGHRVSVKNAGVSSPECRSAVLNPTIPPPSEHLMPSKNYHCLPYKASRGCHPMPLIY